MSVSASPTDHRATLVDLLFQLGYICVYQLMRLYWRLRKPTTHGALVAVWHNGKVLLVRNSYVSYYSAAGGYLRKGESAREAAIRELREEVRMTIEPEQLVQALELTHEWEGRHDHVVIFTLDARERPLVFVDQREVIDAAWFTPEEVELENVFPPLKQVIAARQSAHNESAHNESAHNESAHNESAHNESDSAAR